MQIKTEPKLLRRALSTLVDYGLYVVFFAWLVSTYGVPNDEGGYTLSDDPKLWWIFVAWIVWFPVVECINGQTLGKLILGLKVVSKDGQDISFGQAFKRHLIDLIDLFFFGAVAIIAIKNTPQHQRLGDLLAGTVVIGGEHFVCPACREELTLSPNEIIKRECHCASCHFTTRLN